MNPQLILALWQLAREFPELWQDIQQIREKHAITDEQWDEARKIHEKDPSTYFGARRNPTPPPPAPPEEGAFPYATPLPEEPVDSRLQDGDTILYRDVDMGNGQTRREYMVQQRGVGFAPLGWFALRVVRNEPT